MNSNLDLAGLIKGHLLPLLNDLIVVLAGLAILVFFWGLIGYIREAGDAHGHGHKKEVIQWGLIALFVLFCVWGILNLFQIALFGGGQRTTPQNSATQACQGLQGTMVNGTCQFP